MAMGFHLFTNDGSGEFEETTVTLEGDTNQRMLTFAIWPLGDGRHGILPGDRVFRSEDSRDWKVIVVPREELVTELEFKDGSIRVSFTSRISWVYRIQFSHDLVGWRDGTTAQGDPLVFPGTGGEVSELVGRPNDSALYVRVFAEQE